MNIDKLRETVRDILENHNVKIAPRQGKHGDVYPIRTKDVLLEVTLGKEWIGYDLTVDKEVLGKEIGSFLDTDNYPLDLDTDISLDIFNECMSCMKAVLENKLRIGKVDNKVILAIPQPDGKSYKIITKKRFTSVEQILPAEVVDSMGLSVLQ